MSRQPWFSLLFRKGRKNQLTFVHFYVPPGGLLLPTVLRTKTAAINEAIDRIIEQLETLRPGKRE